MRIYGHFLVPMLQLHFESRAHRRVDEVQNPTKSLNRVVRVRLTYGRTMGERKLAFPGECRMGDIFDSVTRFQKRV